jgi:uncharacterized membrane protein
VDKQESHILIVEILQSVMMVWCHLDMDAQILVILLNIAILHIHMEKRVQRQAVKPKKIVVGLMIQVLQMKTMDIVIAMGLEINVIPVVLGHQVCNRHG